MDRLISRPGLMRVSGLRRLPPFIMCLLLCGTAPVSAATFEKVYSSGSNTDLVEWGRRYELGEGVRPSSSRAIRLYCKAGRRGDPSAQYYLGRIYSSGRGVERNYALAATWYEQAARQNHVQSKNMLRLLGSQSRVSPSCPTGNAGVATRGTRPQRVQSVPVELSRLITRLARDLDLDPRLVLSVIQIESGFNPNARSPKNAQGLMQLLPETAERFGVSDIWDAEENLRGGMLYLRWLLDRYDGDVSLALAAYNAGEGAVDKYQGIPPFAETRSYVTRVRALFDNRESDG